MQDAPVAALLGADPLARCLLAAPGGAVVGAAGTPAPVTAVPAEGAQPTPLPAVPTPTPRPAYDRPPQPGMPAADFTGDLRRGSLPGGLCRAPGARVLLGHRCGYCRRRCDVVDLTPRWRRTASPSWRGSWAARPGGKFAAEAGVFPVLPTPRRVRIATLSRCA